MKKNVRAHSRFNKVIFLGALLFSQISFSAQISGRFSSVGGELSLTSFDQRTVTPLRAFNSQTTGDLLRLSTGDLLAATGEYSGSTFVVTSVDFVGLQELLGVWLSGNNMVNFESFTSVKAHLSTMKKPLSFSMTYSLSPGETNSWRVFFSDKNDVLLGSLTLKKNTAALQFIDAETGETSKVIELRKTPAYQ